MDVTTTVIAISVIAVIIGLITIYLAIWSKYGLGQKLDKGFGNLATSGAQVARDIDKRMGDLIDIIRLLVPKGRTATYQLENIGKVRVSVVDIGENTTTYRVRTEKPICFSKFLLKKANESESLRQSESAFFGEEEATFHCPITELLHVELPSTDKEVCSRFMAFLLKWLDTEYFDSLKEVSEAESTIGKYLQT